MIEMDGLLDCLRRAGDAALEIRRKGELATTEKKGIWDVVTEGDLAAERIIAAWLAEHCSDDGVDGEEGASRPTQSGRVWFNDPIDGTVNYSRGAPFFGISAGRGDENGVSDCGAIRFAAEGWSAWATRGEGAFSGNFGASSPLIAPPGAEALKGALVGVGLAGEYKYLYEVIKAKTRNTVMLGSVTYESLLVARGFWDAYVHTGATPYDVAAATVICREAGCIVTGIHPSDDVRLTRSSIPFMVTRSSELTAELRELIVQNWR